MSKRIKQLEQANKILTEQIKNEHKKRIQVRTLGGDVFIYFYMYIKITCNFNRFYVYIGRSRVCLVRGKMYNAFKEKER